jgi:hypothetical protein
VRRMLGGFLGGLGALLAVIGVLLVVALVNGGYLYRVECPRGGGTETEWTYRWFSVIPYVGYDRSGCETHSATRVALDAIGLWKIDNDDSTADADHSSEYPQALVSEMVDACVASGESRAFCGCAYDEITRRLSPTEFERLAIALQGGAQRFEELPEDLRRKVSDATVAAEADCR